MLCVFDVEIQGHYHISVVDIPLGFTEILDLIKDMEDDEDLMEFVILDLHVIGTVDQQFKCIDQNTGKLIRPNGANLFQWRGGQWFHETQEVKEIVKRLNL